MSGHGALSAKWESQPNWQKLKNIRLQPHAPQHPSSHPPSFHLSLLESASAPKLPATQGTKAISSKGRNKFDSPLLLPLVVSIRPSRSDPSEWPEIKSWAHCINTFRETGTDQKVQLEFAAAISRVSSFLKRLDPTSRLKKPTQPNPAPRRTISEESNDSSQVAQMTCLPPIFKPQLLLFLWYCGLLTWISPLEAAGLFLLPLAYTKGSKYKVCS